MTRPPKARPPPPPATVKSNELRRQQLRSYHKGGNLSPMGFFHPVSPVPSDSRTLSRSFSSSSALDDPDNTSILRGAQILRQQFMERSRSARVLKNKNNKKKETVTPVPERLFPAKNDQAFKDLLGIQPIQPPGSPNDVTLSFSAQEWTDPWNVRGSAFDPAYKRIREQRHEILFGNNHEHPQNEFQNTRSRKETISPPRTSHPTTTAIPLGQTPDWQPTQAFQSDDDTTPLLSLSEQETYVTGPFPLDEDLKGKQDTTINTTMSDELEAFERDIDEQKPLPAPRSDAQAFDTFIDSVSLDDQAFEELVNATDDERVVMPKSHCLWGPPGQLSREEQLQSFVKRVAFATPARSRPERSLSSAGSMLERKPRHRRSHSAGGDRRQYQHQRHQSSLRDDLLCGMETSCKSEFPPEEERLTRSEILDDSCACGPLEYGTAARQRGKEGLSKADKHKLSYAAEMPSFSSSEVVLSEDDKFGVLAPNSGEYVHLQKTDQAFQHAVDGGGLWQALVGNHVRFPTKWWQGRYRTAPLGCPKELAEKNRWVYYDRHRIKGNNFLNDIVKKRDEPGQILLHLVVRDFMTSSPLLDIAIGCFHPNAKSVRATDLPNRRLEDCRDVWMATRFRTEDIISVIDPSFLAEKIGEPKKTPLGDSKRRISNCNVRAIFGDSPPLLTAFVLESDIYEQLSSCDDFQANGPADILLKKYVFQS